MYSCRCSSGPHGCCGWDMSWRSCVVHMLVGSSGYTLAGVPSCGGAESLQWLLRPQSGDWQVQTPLVPGPKLQFQWLGCMSWDSPGSLLGCTVALRMTHTGKVAGPLAALMSTPALLSRRQASRSCCHQPIVFLGGQATVVLILSPVSRTFEATPCCAGTQTSIPPLSKSIAALSPSRPSSSWLHRMGVSP